MGLRELNVIRNECLDNYEPSKTWTCKQQEIYLPILFCAHHCDSKNREIAETSSKIKWLETQIIELNGSMEKVTLELPKVENKLKQNFTDVVKETGNSELRIVKLTKDLKEEHQQEWRKLNDSISGTTSGGNDKDLVKGLGNMMDVNFYGIRMETTRLGSGRSGRTQLLRVSFTRRNIASRFRNVRLCRTLRNSRTSTFIRT